MPQKFVLLEIVDPEISGFINAIREILSDSKINSSVHITIRGPYGDKDKISQDDVDKWNTLLAKDPLFIEDCDRFVNGDKEIVFLKVHHKNLEKVWWKPLYPQDKYGFNPHITVYEGNDRLFASMVCEFLRGEKISLRCDQFRLISYTLRQNDLFDIPDTAYRPPLDLLNHEVISVTLLERLHRLTYNFRRARKATHSSVDKVRD